ncbi:Aste57867_24826 [Aphanomyces stellatus]|uniref:Aste57867_24826 protein n=1 Tax=Aphanomyces stellatus TaxID=120398 RepID=A0A485LSW9_9STRA|nr:hypothetical protein As57867_024748 [Aphanomyces stellatus]VFU01461.1 Aste57867_24826 [Aphanomyces stellatus]
MPGECDGPETPRNAAVVQMSGDRPSGNWRSEINGHMLPPLPLSSIVQFQLADEPLSSPSLISSRTRPRPASFLAQPLPPTASSLQSRSSERTPRPPTSRPRRAEAASPVPSHAPLIVPKPILFQPPPGKVPPLPWRPGFGTVGTRVVLWANLFKVDVADDRAMWHYDVAFAGTPISEELKPKADCIVVMRLVLLLETEFTPTRVVSDPLCCDDESFAFRKVWDVRVKPVHSLSTASLTALCAGKVVRETAAAPPAINGIKANTPQEAIMALDVALRHTAKMNYVAIGRNLYSSMRSEAIGGGAVLWRGYHQSLRPTQSKHGRGGHCICRYDQSLRLCRRGVQLGQYVGAGSRRVYHGVAGDQGAVCQDVASTCKTCQEKIVADYFAQTYKPLRHPEWPCVEYGSAKKPKYLPLELCKVEPGQKPIRKETPDQVTAIRAHTCIKPEARRRLILNDFETAHEEMQNSLGAFGMSVDKQMLEVEGRVLDAPALLNGQKGVMTPPDGTWTLKGKSFVGGRTLRSFAVLSLAPRESYRDIDSFFEALVRQLSQCGMRGPSQRVPIVQRDDESSLETWFARAVEAATDVYRERPQVVFCIKKTTNTGEYRE